MDDLQNIYVWQKNANFLDSGIIREFMVETEWAYYLFVKSLCISRHCLFVDVHMLNVASSIFNRLHLMVSREESSAYCSLV